MKQRSRLVVLVFMSALSCFARAEPIYVDEEFINYRIAENPLDRIPSYRDRRERTGLMLTLGYGQFQPLGYQPDNVVQSYKEVYSPQESGLYDVTLAFKLNFFLGSLSFGAGVGMASAVSSDIAAYGDTEVTFIPHRLEITYALDALFPQPVLVPYGTIGAYSVYFSEKQGLTSFTGTTEAAMFYAGGVNIQLDWLFPEEALSAYKENGQEGTFLFVEGRKYLASAQVPVDPDFETDVMWNGGFKLEF